MSKSTILDQAVKQYILDCIDLSVYDESAETAQETAQKVIGFIMNEADHPYNRKRLITDQAIIADHIMGLPSYFNVDYQHFAILELAIKWGSIPIDHTEKQALKITDNFPSFIACKLMQIANGYRVKNLVLNKGANND